MAWKIALSHSRFACVESEDSPIAVLGVPFDATSTFRPGSRYAPSRIREASCNLELYSLLAQVILEDIGFKDYGDIVLPPGDVAEALAKIEFVLKNVSREHTGLLLILGGEHSITYPAARALRNHVDTLIVFDAHLDARSEYLGSSLNHATFLRKLVNEGFKVVHIGSRAYSKEELEYMSSTDVKVVSAVDLSNKVSNIERLGLGDLGSVYISIDMDVFDPSIAPGVSNPEPFGLDHRLFLWALKSVFERSSDVIALDIVEVNPLVDVGGITSVLAAKIAIEASGLYLKLKSSRGIK